MRTSFPKIRGKPGALWLAALAVGGCMTAGNGNSGNPENLPPTTGPGAPAQVRELPADSQFQRFIVKYRADTPAGGDPAVARQRLAAIEADAGIGLEWLRRLAVDADVFRTSRPLDREQAAALMARFAADPQVEYIDVDGIVTIRRGVEVPPVKPLGDR